MSPHIRPDRRVRAHELKPGDVALILDGEGERRPDRIISAQRDGRAVDVAFESGRESIYQQNDYVYLKARG